MNNKKIIKEILLFAFLLLVGVVSVIHKGNYPGLYMDAVNPDYLSVQIINPQQDRPSWAIFNLGIPLLGQIYHGTITMMCSVISILITGTTSVLQLRVLNSIYGSISCYLVYKILEKIKIKNWIAVAISIALALSANLSSMYVTQYYIELPGVIFSLLSLIMLINWIIDSTNQKFLFLSGFFIGLAFYSYFNFIFLFPSLVCFSLFFLKINDKKRVINRTLICITGFGLGSTLYFCGLVMITMQPLFDIRLFYKKMICIAIVAVYVVLLLVIYRLLNKEDTNYLNLSLIIGIFTIILFVVVKKALSIYESPKVVDYSGNLIDKMRQLFSIIVLILCRCNEEYVLGENVCNGMAWVVKLTVIVVLVGLLYLICFRRSDNRLKWIIGILFISLIYLSCCLPFMGRIHGQHLVIILFVMYLLLGIALDVCLSVISIFFSNAKWMNVGEYCIGFVLILVCFTGVFYQNRVLYSFKQDKPNILYNYSDSIRLISENALKNKENGKKEFYVFPEWGYMMGFDYLTGNLIPYMDALDTDRISELVDDNYTVVICYWKKEEYNSYLEKLSNIDCSYISSDTVSCWGADAEYITISKNN